MKKRNLVLFGTTAMLSLALAGTIGAVTASAEQTITDGSSGSTTTVKYTVDDSWKVTIPSEITIGAAGQEIKAEEVKIGRGYELKVTVTSTNSWKVQASTKGDEHYIEYELKATKGNGNALNNGDAVLTVAAGSASDTDTLTATVKETDANYSTHNEEYTDTLTFNVTASEVAGD